MPCGYGHEALPFKFQLGMCNCMYTNALQFMTQYQIGHTRERERESCNGSWKRIGICVVCSVTETDNLTIFIFHEYCQILARLHAVSQREIDIY